MKKYEYLGLERKVMLHGKKITLIPGKVYPFDEYPGSDFREVVKTVKKKEVPRGTDS